MNLSEVVIICSLLEIVNKTYLSLSGLEQLGQGEVVEQADSCHVQ